MFTILVRLLYIMGSLRPGLRSLRQRKGGGTSTTQLSGDETRRFLVSQSVGLRVPRLIETTGTWILLLWSRLLNSPQHCCSPTQELFLRFCFSIIKIIERNSVEKCLYYEMYIWYIHMLKKLLFLKYLLNNLLLEFILEYEVICKCYIFNKNILKL